MFEIKTVACNSLKEMNDYIKNAINLSPAGMYYGKPETFDKRKYRAFIWETDVTLWLSYYDKGHVIRVAFRMDGEFLPKKTAMNIWKDFSRCYKTPRFHDDKEKAPFSARPFMYYNEKYNETRQKAIGYDLNSAYANAVLHADLPNTAICKMFEKVEKGWMGYNIKGELIPVGKQAAWCFPIMTEEEKKPIVDYFKYWWNVKKNATTQEEKIDAKSHLNIVVGYWQKYNCFMRAAVVEYVNNYIQSIIENRDDVLMCNTDSIVCRNEIPELQLGDDIGQWKVEHKGQFAYVGFNYQWNKQKPAYRGISKTWFSKEYDILTDGIPTENNIYEFDKEKLRIKRKE